MVRFQTMSGPPIERLRTAATMECSNSNPAIWQRESPPHREEITANASTRHVFNSCQLSHTMKNYTRFSCERVRKLTAESSRTRLDIVVVPSLEIVYSYVMLSPKLAASTLPWYDPVLSVLGAAYNVKKSTCTCTKGETCLHHRFRFGHFAAAATSRSSELQ